MVEAESQKKLFSAKNHNFQLREITQSSVDQTIDSARKLRPKIDIFDYWKKTHETEDEFYNAKKKIKLESKKQTDLLS